MDSPCITAAARALVEIETNLDFLTAVSRWLTRVTGTVNIVSDRPVSKDMLYELLLSTLQFKVFLPTGDAGRGLGTGHVSIEPSLVSALR